MSHVLISHGKTACSPCGVNKTCILDFSPDYKKHTENGGVGTISLVANKHSCSWIITSDVPWIRITSSNSGIGSDSVKYTVLPNDTKEVRIGRIIADGEVAVIVQEASIREEARVVTGGVGTPTFEDLITVSAEPLLPYIHTRQIIHKERKKKVTVIATLLRSRNDKN
jgi:hypothetical protein